MCILYLPPPKLLPSHEPPRVLSSSVTSRLSLRQSYRAGLGGWEARSVCRGREVPEMATIEGRGLTTPGDLPRCEGMDSSRG